MLSTSLKLSNRPSTKRLVNVIVKEDTEETMTNLQQRRHSNKSVKIFIMSFWTARQRTNLLDYYY